MMMMMIIIIIIIVIIIMYKLLVTTSSFIFIFSKDLKNVNLLSPAALRISSIHAIDFKALCKM
jgi:hypothetical protein